MVRLCASTLAGLSNCIGIQDFGVSFWSSLARAMAPFIPSSRGVRSSSAPYAFIRRRRSMENDSGMQRMSRYPLTAATRARPMPVLPEVGSMSTEPGPMIPAFSASSIIPRAIRSLMLPPGLTRSCLAQTVTRGSKRRLIRT